MNVYNSDSRQLWGGSCLRYLGAQGQVSCLHGHRGSVASVASVYQERSQTLLGPTVLMRKLQSIGTQLGQKFALSEAWQTHEDKVFFPVDSAFVT